MVNKSSKEKERIDSELLLKRNPKEKETMMLNRKEGQKTEFSPNVKRDPLWLSTINTYLLTHINK